MYVVHTRKDHVSILLFFGGFGIYCHKEGVFMKELKVLCAMKTGRPGLLRTAFI